MPYGEWEPRFHRWCSAEVRRDILVVLMLGRRRGLPNMVVVRHLLPWVCTLPRPCEMSEGQELLAGQARLEWRQEKMEQKMSRMEEGLTRMEEGHARLEGMLGAVLELRKK